MDKFFRWSLIATVLFCLLFVTTTSLLATEIEIKQVELTGYGELSEEMLMEVIQVEPGDTLVEEEVREDMQRLYDLGYFFDVEATTRTHEDGVRLIYTLHLNPTVTGVEFIGNQQIADSTLEELLGIEFDIPLNTIQLQEGLEVIRNYYEEHGYILAQIVDIEVERETGELMVVLEEGQLAEIRITGNEKTRDYVIRRELSHEPGDVFNREQARQERQRIFNLGYFDDVQIELEASPEFPGQMTMKLEVDERKTGNVNLGAGYSSRDGWIGYFDVSEQNLLGRGQKIDFSYKFGEKTSYELSFFEPWLDDQQTSFGMDLYSTTVERELDDTRYQRRRQGGLVSFGRPTGEDNRTYIRGKYEGTDIIPVADQDPGDGVDYVEGEITRSVILSNVTDTRDNPFNPGMGRRDEVTIEYAGQLLGGDSDFTKYDLDLRRFIPALRDQHTLALRLRGGMGSTPGQKGLPLQEAYTLGGAETLRGYPDHSIRGDRFLLFNTEYRITVVDNVDAALFFDTGQAWKMEDPLDLSEVDTSYGLGVRLNTPLGQIRLDYGIPTDKRVDQGRLHFSLGQVF